MHFKIKLSFIAIFAIVLSACSPSRQEFIIVNNTGEALIVQYSYKDKERVIYKPRVTASEKFDAPGKKWRELSSNVFDVDAETRVVHTKVEAMQALLIYTAENYTNSKSDDFPLEMLSFIGKSGNKLLEHKDVQEAFEKQKNGNYAIFYK
jgi:hypothetical protein